MTSGNAAVNDIRFSVVIPAYNAEQTIIRAIDSVLAQSYPAYEIIVVDDASKDKTSELVQNTYGNKVKFLQKVSNGGSSVTRNAGMDIATGDYFAFLDADDAWHRDKLMLMNSILKSKPDITLFYHPYTQEDLSGKKLPEGIMIYKLPFIKLLPSNPIATSCLILKNKPEFRFEPTMRYTEDYELCMRVGYKHKIYFINIPLTQIFRKFTTSGGISENTWKMRKGEMRAYSRLVKLNPVFLPLLPVLLLSSLGRHLYKKVVKKDKGYFEH